MPDSRSEELLAGKEINRTRKAKTFIVVPVLNKLNWGHSKELHGHSPLCQTLLHLQNSWYVMRPT